MDRKIKILLSFNINFKDDKSFLIEKSMSDLVNNLSSNIEKLIYDESNILKIDNIRSELNIKEFNEDE